MTYEDLKEHFEWFHFGRISKIELGVAIIMWQRAGAVV